jgi:hypothetical protein
MWRPGILIVALWGTVAAADPTYVERPLLLQNGVIEGEIVGQTFETEDESNLYRWGVLSPTLRYGFGVAELEVGLTLPKYLYSNDYDEGPFKDSETFQSAFAAGHVLLGSETAATLRFEARSPTSDKLRGYITSAFLSHKWHPSSATSIQAIGGGSYVHFDGDYYMGTNVMDLVASVRGAVQVMPTLAFEGRVTFEQIASDGARDTFNTSRLSAGLVWSVTRAVDVVATVEHSSAAIGTTSVGEGEFSPGGSMLSVGFVARKIP